jgi:L,D-peptidoglycan transpeptidase YkuD (ErfK/YbiS/YcfS/YnhG family)
MSGLACAAATRNLQTNVVFGRGAVAGSNIFGVRYENGSGLSAALFFHVTSGGVWPDCGR